MEVLEERECKICGVWFQASGFATQADAYNALDKEIAAGTLQHIDRN